MDFLRPDPVLLVFFAVKQTAWLPFVLVLALVRVAFARRAARWLALLAAVIATLGIAVQIVPGWLNVYDSPLVAWGSRWRNAWGGLLALASASLPLLLSSYATGRRFWGIDVLHILALLALLGLWAYSLYG
ncbi:hypothetical protein [Wenxinia marina]|uniref:Uncharacterized protein n=1 Tax=Wenxinia marina DSM 24838 TaxID=1123501 RepID=A0A0D0Q271_9RHOB|nr:hypothetical protein [Wenxinia marina]KIQ68624.1 hypothetical protein Wenmar_02895 [Wenxinia marina DSM 24838]GGL67387.1 hypothetical protein GCM10011392_22390 [Wenxinia marina]